MHANECMCVVCIFEINHTQFLHLVCNHRQNALEYLCFLYFYENKTGDRQSVSTHNKPPNDETRRQETNTKRRQPEFLAEAVRTQPMLKCCTRQTADRHTKRVSKRLRAHASRNTRLGIVALMRKLQNLWSTFSSRPLPNGIEKK